MRLLKKATIAAAGLGAFFAIEKANAQTTWKTRGLSHEQIKDLMDGDGRNDASPGDTIKFNVTSYTMPFLVDPFIVGIDKLTITGNSNTMDGTIIQNHEDIKNLNGLVFEFRATNCKVQNMTIENIQIGIKAGQLQQEKTMYLKVDNLLIRNTDISIFSDSAQDGDGDINRQGIENFLMLNSIVRDSNIAFLSGNEERNRKARYGVLRDNTFINCNLAFGSTWYCENGNYPCSCDKIYVPGVGRTDRNTFNGYNKGQSFTNEFRCGNGDGGEVPLPNNDTADKTIEYLVTNPTLYDLNIGIDNLEVDPKESYWGFVADRSSPRLGGENGKTITRGGRKSYFADSDGDGDVDMKDVQAFQNYFSGNATYTIDDRANITWADWNGEDIIKKVEGIRINLTDHANLVPAMTGPEFND